MPVNPVDNLLGAGLPPQVGEHKGPLSTGTPRIAFHYRQIGANVGRQVDLVYHRQSRSHDAWSALARAAFGHINEMDGGVYEFRADAQSGEANGGGFNNALGRLRTLDLVHGHGGGKRPLGERGEDNGRLLFEGMTSGKG